MLDMLVGRRRHDHMGPGWGASVEDGRGDVAYRHTPGPVLSFVRFKFRFEFGLVLSKKNRHFAI